MVFNKIFDIVTKNKIATSFIIFCGGETDMIRPYKRNEADEMIKFFTEFIRKKTFLNSITKNWLLIAENKSLSTLENLLNSKKILDKKKIKKAKIFVFCEQTREKRIKVLTEKIFDKNYNFQITPIDFDVSANRYLSQDFIAKKEKIELEHALWALENPENLKKHHEVFREKIEYLRKAELKVHGEAVKKWWKQKLRTLKNKSNAV